MNFWEKKQFYFICGQNILVYGIDKNHMKAVIFRQHGNVDVLEVTDIEKPKINNFDVMIKVDTFALNRLDIWVRNGSPTLKIPLPHIGASDFAGTVEEIGSDVSLFNVGDRVVVNAGIGCGVCEVCRAGEQSLCNEFKMIGEHIWGGAAEYAVVPQTNLIKIPDNITFETAAAAALTTLTTYRMLKRAKIAPNDDILVIGASGGIGTIAVQMAKYMGKRVIALTSTEEKEKKLLELGADITINYNKTPEWSKEVWRITNKKGVDIVVDSVGQMVWKNALRSLKKGGRLVTCGATSGINGETNIALVFWKQIEIIGSTMASNSEFIEAMNMVFNKKISPVIDSIYSIDEIKNAHQRLESGEHFGKIIVKVNSM